MPVAKSKPSRRSALHRETAAGAEFVLKFVPGANSKINNRIAKAVALADRAELNRMAVRGK